MNAGTPITYNTPNTMARICITEICDRRTSTQEKRAHEHNTHNTSVMQMQPLAPPPPPHTQPPPTQTRARTHAHTHTHTNTHKHAHTHTQTHTQIGQHSHAFQTLLVMHGLDGNATRQHNSPLLSMYAHPLSVKIWCAKLKCVKVAIAHLRHKHTYTHTHSPLCHTAAPSYRARLSQQACTSLSRGTERCAEAVAWTSPKK